MRLRLRFSPCLSSAEPREGRGAETAACRRFGGDLFGPPGRSTSSPPPACRRRADRRGAAPREVMDMVLVRAGCPLRLFLACLLARTGRLNLARSASGGHGWSPGPAPWRRGAPHGWGEGGAFFRGDQFLYNYSYTFLEACFSLFLKACFSLVLESCFRYVKMP